MRTTARKLTREDYLRTPENVRLDLIEGEFFVRETPPEYQHQRVVGQLHLTCAPLFGHERVVMAPFKVEIDEHSVLEPDVGVFDAPVPAHTKYAGVPAVVFEVLSPSTARIDRKRKPALYLRAGVREVWIVDPDSGAIEIHKQGGVTTHGPDDPATSTAVPGFTVRGRDLVR